MCFGSVFLFVGVFLSWSPFDLSGLPYISDNCGNSLFLLACIDLSWVFFSVPTEIPTSNPAHQSAAVDEHYFLNESAAQVRYGKDM